MSGILTQDSISLTEDLDGVRFCYLAISSGKAGTIGRKHAEDTNKRAKSYCFVSRELRGNGYQRRCSSRRWSKEVKGDGHFTCVRGRKVKPNAFPGGELQCQLYKTAPSAND